MDFLLAALLTCNEGRRILEHIGAVELTSPERSELVIEIIREMPRDCRYYDYNAWRNGGRRGF